VLWEHGNWGNNSAKLAAQVITAFVNKQRSRAGNLVRVAAEPKPVAPDHESPDAAPVPVPVLPRKPAVVLSPVAQVSTRSSN
jgi:penicillin-binding protein 2